MCAPSAVIYHFYIIITPKTRRFCRCDVTNDSSKSLIASNNEAEIRDRWGCPFVSLIYVSTIVQHSPQKIDKEFSKLKVL